VDGQTVVIGLGLAVSAAVLCAASYLDWRTRRVSNKFWILLSVVAMTLLIARVFADDAPLEYLLILVPVLAILADIYLDLGEDNNLSGIISIVEYSLAIVAVVYLGYLWADDEYFVHLMTIPVMMLIVVLLYALDVVRGGADAKALVALSIMFPFHPSVASLPLIDPQHSISEIMFPFSFVVLVNAAFMVAFLPILFAAKNLASGEFRSPHGFLGYMMDVETAREKHVWLMERIVDGKHRMYTRPKRAENLDTELTLLTDAGYDRVWITPKIPFIIPLFVSLLFTTVVGNLLVLVMGV